ncbi:MAG: M56 family metallopeptidase, partial [Actinomycetota bacterium]
MSAALTIAVVGVLALSAPALAAMVVDRRSSPRATAVLHLLALIGMGFVPIAMLLCLGGPGSLLRACHGTFEHHSHVLRWIALGAAGAMVSWLAYTAARTLRATRAADPGRLRLGLPTAISGGVPVYLIPVEQPVAYASGIRRGQVVVSEGLVRLLTDEERRAAVAHEVAHVRGGHPGLLFIGGVVARAFSALPPATRAFASLRRELEAAADDEAARAVGDPQVVARAIAKVGLAGAAPAPGAALAEEADVAYRVGRLLEHRPES